MGQGSTEHTATGLMEEGPAWPGVSRSFRTDRTSSTSLTELPVLFGDCSDRMQASSPGAGTPVVSGSCHVQSGCKPLVSHLQGEGKRAGLPRAPRRNSPSVANRQPWEQRALCTGGGQHGTRGRFKRESNTHAQALSLGARGCAASFQGGAGSPRKQLTGLGGSVWSRVQFSLHVGVFSPHCPGRGAESLPPSPCQQRNRNCYWTPPTGPAPPPGATRPS